MPKPLEGILVADFTTLLPGPLATLLLAEAGAEVVKIERPGGEDVRHFPPFWAGHSAAFAFLNRGKKSLIADLKRDADKARVFELVDRADVLVEQFRPGVMERLGLGYEAVRARNPGIVYCSITGYGQEGPRRNEAGHDINYIGATGLLSLSPGSMERPTVPPALIADIGGGSFPAVMNILLALIGRQKSGKGAYLDIAMSDAMFTFAWLALATRFATGKAIEPDKLRHFGGSPRYQLYPTSGGKLVACGALEQKFWESFCATIGLPKEFVDDRRDPKATIEAVRAIIASETAEHWRPLFAKADCCVTIMASIEEALHDPHFVARGLFEHKVSAPGGETMPALPVPISPALRVEEKTRGLPPLGELK
ncbi:MAG TPA: CaiB/BaiF CoA-transferase family protein [Xanthobacteraceae bacterium]|nr:CaiB/BaiF CoA-transferase family protein [Xanthobacteraceae bacterium]